MKNLDVAERCVLLRADLDVSLDAQGRILDDRRITTSLPTIEYLIQQKARTIILAHLGRPGGIRRADLSLRPVAHRLEQRLQIPVAFAPECIGQTARDAAEGLHPGGLLVLENLRFYPGEEANDASFAQELAELGDAYVNDAFGTSHRKHASTYGIARHFSPCAAGLTLSKEISALEDFLDRSRKINVQDKASKKRESKETMKRGRPSLFLELLNYLDDYLSRKALSKNRLSLLLGGNKVKSKLSGVQKILEQTGVLLIGGAVANACLKARGIGVGSSRVLDEDVVRARGTLAQARAAGVQVVLPTDLVIRRPGSTHGPRPTVSSGSIPDGWEAVDIGPESRASFSRHIARARQLVWSGPLGVYEDNHLIAGTAAVARSISNRFKAGQLLLLVGGGDTAVALKKLGLDSKMGHVSVGGSAMLAFLAGNPMRGIDVLTDKHVRP